MSLHFNSHFFLVNMG